MPKCKFCGENITKFDKEFCPFCGGKKPLEDVEVATNDVTQVINTVEEKKSKNLKEHKKLTNALLTMFLGIFGANYFYLGFIWQGFTRILVGFALIGVVACLFYFLGVLGIGYALLVGLGVDFLVSLVIGITYLFKDNKKDAHGEFLR